MFALVAAAAGTWVVQRCPSSSAWASVESSSRSQDHGGLGLGPGPHAALPSTGRIPSSSSSCVSQRLLRCDTQQTRKCTGATPRRQRSLTLWGMFVRDARPALRALFSLWRDSQSRSGWCFASRPPRPAQAPHALVQPPTSGGHRPLPTPSAEVRWTAPHALARPNLFPPRSRGVNSASPPRRAGGAAKAHRCFSPSQPKPKGANPSPARHTRPAQNSAHNRAGRPAPKVTSARE